MVASPLKLLVVDGDPEPIVALRSTLHAALPEAMVLTAKNGDEGRLLAMIEDPTMIVLALREEGIALCRSLKADERLQHIPVVFLATPQDRRESRLGALAAGADGFLATPLEAAELIAQARSMAKVKAANQKGSREPPRPSSAAQRPEEGRRGEDARLRAIDRATPAGIGVVVQRVIQEVNDTLCQMTGYTRAELIGQSARILYPTVEDYEYVGREKYRQLAEGDFGAVETRWQRKDGAIIDVLLSSAAVDPSDLAGEVVFMALDITERKRMEAALQERERQTRRQNEVLLQLMARGALFRTDLSAALAEITEAAAEIIGVERVGVWRYSQDFRTIECLDLYERSRRRHSAGETVRVVDFPSYVQCHLRGEVIAATDVRADPRTREIPASYWDEHGIYSLVDAPVWVHGALGGIVSFEQVGGPRQWTPEDERLCASMATLVSLCFEAAERARAEKALRESEECYRTLVEILPEGVVMADPEGLLLLANRRMADLFGYEDPQEIVGSDLLEWFAPEERARVAVAFDAFLERGGFLESEYTMLRRDGTRFPAAVSASLLREESGAPRALIGIVRDITERKQMHRQLTEQVEELRRWYAAMLGRETRVLELKREVNELLAQAGRPPRYPSVDAE